MKGHEIQIFIFLCCRALKICFSEKRKLQYRYFYYQILCEKFSFIFLTGLKEMDADDSDDETLISDMSENKAKSGIWSTLTSLVGSKQLTDADVQPVINKMRDHLISKNVASEVADKLCQSVASKLEGKVLGKSCHLRLLNCFWIKIRYRACASISRSWSLTVPLKFLAETQFLCAFYVAI